LNLQKKFPDSSLTLKKLCSDRRSPDQNEKKRPYHLTGIFFFNAIYKHKKTPEEKKKKSPAFQGCCVFQ